jgi:hypothetical protein
MTTQTRIIVTVVFAVVIGAWAFLEQKQISLYSQGTYETLHSTIADFLVISLPIAVGVLVRRPWVLFALIGPFLSLGCLQVTGYRSPWHDGEPPLLSPPGIFWFIFMAVLLWLGVVLGRLAVRRRGDPAASDRP